MLSLRRLEIRVADRVLALEAPVDRDAARRDPTDRATWAVPWPAGLLLADRVAALPGGGRAIELGCGLGLVGTVAALSGWDLTFTDRDPRAVDLAVANARANGAASVRGVVMDWERPIETRFDRVLAADVLYERRLHDPLLGAIQALLAPGGLAWIADPGRPSAREFPARAGARGFAVRTESLEGTDEAGWPRTGVLHVLSPPGP